MATTPRRIVPMATTPRRIVPMLTPAQAGIAGPAAPPHLAYHNGHLLTAVEVFTIFWGAAWEQPAQSGLVPQLNQYFDFILTSSLIDLLAEYSVPGQAIGHGSRINTRTITTSEPGGGSGQISDAQIQQTLQGWIANGTIPPATSNMLYFVYLPPGVTSILDGFQSCQPGGFCGYHNQINGTIFYAVEPFITCLGCTFGQVLDSLTKVSSHELCEAITDPALNAWFDDTPPGNEIGDICNTTVQQLGGFTIQLEWSNKANACRLAPAAGWQWANQGRPAGVSLGGAVGTLTVMDTPTSSQRPYAFVEGSDGNLWVNWWDGATWQWANQGTPAGVSLGRAVGTLTVMDTPTSSQRPYAFVEGSDGNLWVNWWDGATWQWANQGTPAGVSLRGAVGTLTVMDTPTSSQRPYAFVEGSDGNLWVNWWDGATWQWANQGTPAGVGLGGAVGTLTVMDTPTSSQRPYAFVEGSDGNLWVNWWDGATWQWANQGRPAGVSLGRAVGTLTVMDTPTSFQRPYAFVEGSDGNLWVNWWDGATWQWANQGRPAGVSLGRAVGTLTVMDTPTSSQRPYAFVEGSDGNLWVNWWDGATWQWANQGRPAGVGLGRAVGTLTVMDTPTSFQRPYAFVEGSDGNLWVNWWS